MKILALEIELENAPPASEELLAREARALWALVQSGVVRETYFRADRRAAVLVLEAPDVSNAGESLRTLPLVLAGHIRFELVPLEAYSGFARLFEGDTK